MKPRLLTTLVVIAVGIGAAAALDAAGAVRFGPDIGVRALGVAASSACGAVSAVLGTVAARRRPSRRAALLAGLFGASGGLLLVTSALPWVGLGPFGAGPAGELTWLVLPIAAALGGLYGGERHRSAASAAGSDTGSEHDRPRHT